MIGKCKDMFKSWIEAYCNGRSISLLQRMELKKSFYAGWIGGATYYRTILNKYSIEAAKEIVGKEVHDAAEEAIKDLDQVNQN